MDVLAPNLGALDNEPKEVERIEVALAVFDKARFEYAYDYRGFIGLMERHSFDAVSIDWELSGGVHKGPHLLAFLGRNHPDVGKVVYTRFQEFRDNAFYWGADAYLVKSIDGDMREYRAVMSEAARLGLARKIVRRMRELQQEGLPELPPGQLLNPEAESIIFSRVKEFTRAQRLKGREDEVMSELLGRRGWHFGADFDAGAYARLPWRDKVEQLARYVEITPEDMARILGADAESVKILLGMESGHILDRSLLQSADWLLSVLGYVFRLSEYEPERMPRYWAVKNLYEHSFDPPPWNRVGLNTFLINSGPQGLYESLVWIRSH